MNYEDIYIKAKSECPYLEDESVTKVYVASASDNANAADILHRFQEDIKNRSVDARVFSTGSFGYYDLEPIVLIEKAGRSAILYNNVTPETASSIVNDTIAGDNPRPDLAFCTMGRDRVEGVSASSDLALFSLQNRIALRNCGHIDPENINHYILRGNGYRGFSKALQMKQSEVIEALSKSGLRGRGGAGYVTSDKWQACYETEHNEKYVVCNAADSDPRSMTARLLLESDPHGVLEGMLISAYVVNASHLIVYVNKTYVNGIMRLEKAIEQMRQYGLVGKNILDLGFSAEIDIRLAVGSLVSGEETALIRSLEGKQCMPYIRTAYPAVKGFQNKPTLINDIETLADVSAIFQKGSEWFAGFGTDKSKGTKVMTLSGVVVHKYSIEVNFGTTLEQVVNAFGGGVSGGKDIKVVQLGGPIGAFFGVDSLDLQIDYEAVEQAGTIMGSGSIEVIDEDSCVVGVTNDLMTYIQEQSCGKCVFCREGSLQMAMILNDIKEGMGKPKDIDLLNDLGEHMKIGCICSLGRNAPNPVLSGLKIFREDYDAYINKKR